MRKLRARYAVDSNGFYARKGKWRAHCLFCPAWFGNDLIGERITQHSREAHQIAKPEVTTHWRWVKFEKIPVGVEHRLDRSLPLLPPNQSSGVVRVAEDVTAKPSPHAVCATMLNISVGPKKLYKKPKQES